jgi:hypothetical protein
MALREQDTEEPCECCGREVDDCICEECPRCHEVGNPDCYEGKCTELVPCPKCFLGQCTNAEGMNCPPPRLRYTRDQRIGQAKLRISDLEQRIHDEQMYVAHLEDMAPDWRDE